MVVGYALKADIKHYFDTVDLEILMRIVRKKIKDEKVLQLIKTVLDNHDFKIQGKGMPYGAGTIAARKYNCQVIDARKYAVGSLKEVYKKYPHLSKELPAMGYSKKQVKELEKTINSAKCDAVIDATPVTLPRIIKINKPVVQVNYELQEVGKLNLQDILNKF